MERILNISLLANRLNGSIPRELGNITTLTTFTVEDNLSGRIPEELGNLPSIERFFLNSNYFTGDLPSSFANLITIKELNEIISGTLTRASDKSSGAKSTSTPSTPGDNRILPTESRHSLSSPSECTSFGFLSEARQDREINKDIFLQQKASPTSIKTNDQIDILREQQRILSGEVAKHLTALKRLSEEAARDTNNDTVKVEMTKLNDEIKRTNKQISLLENQTTNSAISSHHKMDDFEHSQSVASFEAQVNDKSFELEVCHFAILCASVVNIVFTWIICFRRCKCENLRETLKSNIPCHIVILNIFHVSSTISLHDIFYTHQCQRRVNVKSNPNNSKNTTSSVQE